MQLKLILTVVFVLSGYSNGFPHFNPKNNRMQLSETTTIQPQMMIVEILLPQANVTSTPDVKINNGFKDERMQINNGTSIPRDVQV